MKSLHEELVPENCHGKPVDLEHAVTSATREEAIALFKMGCQRLFTPAGWHIYAGGLSASFQLMDAQNHELYHRPQRGDFIRIDIPGPGGPAGEGFDWVQVDAVIDQSNPSAESEQAGFRARTANRPDSQDPAPAHFFADGATSTFILERRGLTVTARYFGRNEVPNTSTEKTVDKVRNAVVAWGALAGFSDLQWNGLIKGWLETPAG